jgi:WD40 repeat protein
MGGSTDAPRRTGPQPGNGVAAPVTSPPGYDILEELGRGGMGVVYKARHLALRRIIALKMILGGAYASGAHLDRFRTEAEAIARLQHPHIVQIHEVGEHEGLPYLALEYCDGGSLARKLAGTPLQPAAAAALVEKLASATQAAHDKGVIHRDLKPGNVLLAEDGTPKISDFGLAKRLDDTGKIIADGLTETGAIMGSPSYMAPEQAGGKSKQLGPACDIYALGAILYECLTGRAPFQAATPWDTVMQVANVEPVPPARLNPKVPRDLETICLKCLQKEPGKRYASAADLADDLRRFQAGEVIRARPVGKLERTLKWVRRRPAVASLLAAVALLIVVGLGSFAWAFSLVLDARDEADDQRRQAVDDRKLAQEQKRLADLARQRAQERLIRLNLVTGNFLTETGDYGSALLRYCQAWMLDDDAASEPLHRLRLACVLARCPTLEGICLHQSGVLEAHFNASADRVLARTEDGRAFLWDPYRSQPVAAPLPHDGKLSCATLSQDGTRAVTTGTDAARLWDAATGKALGAPLTHPAVVYHAAFSPDGQRLATACADGTVRFWSVPDGQLLEPTVSVGGEVRFVGFSPDGGLVVTVAGNAARVWDTADAKPLTPPLPHRLTPGNPVDRLFQPPLFSPDSSRLLTSDAQTIRVCNARTGAQAMPPFKSPYGLNRVAFSADGSRILLLGHSSSSLILDAATARPNLTLYHPREVQVGCFSPDGKLVATTSSKGLIHVRDAKTGKDVVPPFRHAANVTDLAFTAAGDRLLSVSLDGTVRIWAIGLEPFKAMPYDYTCGHADHLVGRFLSPDGAWEVRPDGASGARLQRRSGGATGPVLAHAGQVKKALFAPDGQTVLTADDKGVQVWEAGTGQARGPLLPINGNLTWAQFSDDGSHVMLIDAGGKVSVYETKCGRLLLGPIALDADIQRSHLLRRVVALSPDGRRLAVHFPSRVETRVYEVATGRSLVTAGLDGILASLGFSPDSKRLLTAASDTMARVWNAETGEPVGPAMRHPTFVRLAVFGPDGRLVVTHDGGFVRLWDSVTGGLLSPPIPNQLAIPAGQGHMADFWFCRHGRRIIGLAPNGTVKQWELPVFRAAKSRVPSLVQLLTGQQVDANDAIVPLDRSAFRADPEEYRRAWLSWRGLDGQPGAP